MGETCGNFLVLLTSVAESLRITNINGNINTNVKNLFEISAASFEQNFYVCVYVSVYVRNSPTP